MKPLGFPGIVSNINVCRLCVSPGAGIRIFVLLIIIRTTGVRCEHVEMGENEEGVEGKRKVTLELGAGAGFTTFIAGRRHGES